MTVKAIALNYTLKVEGDSSTDGMIAVLKDAFAKLDVEITQTVRVAALDIRPVVTSDEGDGDEWPDLRRNILDHDILVFGGRSGRVRSAASPSV